MDNQQIVMKIVNEIDQNLTESQKLAKAQEKLAIILSKRAEQQDRLRRQQQEAQDRVPPPPPPVSHRTPGESQTFPELHL